MTPVAVSGTWAVTRAAGTVSLVLLTASVLLGLLTWSRWGRRGWPRFLTADLHRNVSLLAVCFVVLHVISVLVDGYVNVRVVDAVVPFVSNYRPIWLGLGAVAFDLLVALAVTSLLRRRLGYRAWRTMHYLVYACWAVALVHGLGTGTDPRSSWFEILAAVCAGAVGVAGLWRVARARSVSPQRRAGLAAVSLAALAGVAAWTATGPLRAGWAARAGTPPDLLASSRLVAARSAAALPATPFELRFDGSYEANVGSDGSARVRIDGSLDETAARLRVDVVGVAQSGSIVPSSIEVAYGSADNPDEFKGSGQLASSNEIAARVSDGAQALDLTITVELDQSSSAASGVVTAAAAGTA